MREPVWMSGDEAVPLSNGAAAERGRLLRQMMGRLSGDVDGFDGVVAEHKQLGEEIAQYRALLKVEQRIDKQFNIE